MTIYSYKNHLTNKIYEYKAVHDLKLVDSNPAGNDKQIRHTGTCKYHLNRGKGILIYKRPISN